MANTETIVGGSGADTITLGSALSDSMSVDLGGGSNKLTLDNSADTGTVKNVGTLIGGTGDDTITFGKAALNASVSLGSGNDSLALRQRHQQRNGGEHRHHHRRDRQRHHLAGLGVDDQHVD